MDIITSYTKNELEAIIVASIQKCLGTPTPPQPEQTDRIDINEACLVTGYRKPTLYKMSFEGKVPCEKFGKRLIFSRKKLAIWMAERTTTRQSLNEMAVDHLKAEANKRS